jgi:hypothetical protein
MPIVELLSGPWVGLKVTTGINALTTSKIPKIFPRKITFNKKFKKLKNKNF